eukprot:4711192-Prymnesium_polylepis.5
MPSVTPAGTLTNSQAPLHSNWTSCPGCTPGGQAISNRTVGICSSDPAWHAMAEGARSRSCEEKV